MPLSIQHFPSALRPAGRAWQPVPFISNAFIHNFITDPRDPLDRRMSGAWLFSSLSASGRAAILPRRPQAAASKRGFHKISVFGPIPKKPIFSPK
jgi:hypothetical protein